MAPTSLFRPTSLINLSIQVEAIIAEKVFYYPKRPGGVGFLQAKIFFTLSLDFNRLTSLSFQAVLSTFKVRWKGYGKEHDTWEPEGHLMGCKHLLKEWRTANPLFVITCLHSTSILTNYCSSRSPAQHGNGKRKTSTDIDSGSPGSSGSEKPSKMSRVGHVVPFPFSRVNSIKRHVPGLSQGLRHMPDGGKASP